MKRTFNAFKHLFAASGAERTALIFLFILALTSIVLDVALLPPAPAAIGVGALIAAGALIVHFGAARGDERLTSRTEGLQLAAVTQNLKEGLIVYDPSFRIVAWNPAAERIFGITSAEAIGTVVSPRLSGDAKFATLTQVIFPSLAPSIEDLSEANVWPSVVRITTERPNLRLEVTLDRITDERGKVALFLKLVRDETREQAILASKNEFINTAAHQLRTPLTAINWALENIKKSAEGVSDEIGATASEALGVSERALKITNDLLDVAKIEEGRFGYRFEESDFVTFIDDVVGSLLPVAKQYGVVLSFFHGGIGSLPVQIDKNRLGLALFNLIDNAIKYNSKNGMVEVSLERGLGERPFAKVSVKDSGVGIPDEEKQKIFKKFHRGANVTQLEPNGNGLGLFITRNIVKQHGGDIGFESEINRGTTFWFTLPLDARLVPQKEIVREDQV